jgi:broad specificity phosphatase PhoE
VGRVCAEAERTPGGRRGLTRDRPGAAGWPGLPGHRGPTRRRALVPTVALLACLSLAAARVEAQGTTVVLVRHAEKAAPTGDPDLSTVGEARARALADAVRHFRLDGIVVTQYRRTLATAAPAAAVRGLVPVVVATGASVAVHAESVAAAVRRSPARSAVLVVGHSNTLGAIIAALGGPVTPDLCDAEYATLFVLTLAADGAPTRLLRARYGAPDPPAADSCPR